MRWTVSVIVFFAFFCSAAAATAQGVPAELAPPAGPFLILANANGQPTNWPEGFVGRNVSKRRIVTVVIGVELLSADGTVLLKDGHGYSRLGTARRWIAPGEQDPLSLPRINFPPHQVPAKAKVWVDLVIYANGDTWGPDSLGQSAHWAGVRDGIRIERRHLGRILKRAGVSGVKAALAAH